MGALLLLMRQVLGSRLVQGVGGGLALGSGFDILGGEDKPKRRRRKRALNANDREDIAFMASFMTKAGLERAVAVMLAR